MKKVIAVTLAVAILSGCATRKPNPVRLMEPTDSAMVCQELVVEMAAMESRIEAARKAKKMQTAQNVAAGITGALVVLPLLAMDLGNAPGVEKQAAKSRLEYLNQLYLKKECNA